MLVAPDVAVARRCATRDERESLGINGVGPRGEILRLPESLGESHLAEVTEELDRLGPLGLWQEVVRIELEDHGFVQGAKEMFAETVARGLGISLAELKDSMHQGRLGDALVDRFLVPNIATDNGG